jgi:hypothetical protein
MFNRLDLVKNIGIRLIEIVTLFFDSLFEVSVESLVNVINKLIGLILVIIYC